MPPILSSTPHVAPQAARQAGWLLPAGFLLLLLLLSRWLQPPAVSSHRPIASTETLRLLPQPGLASTPTSAL